MKKYYIAIVSLSLIILCACSLINTPSMKVSEYLNNYNSLSEAVVEDMESSILEENLSVDNANLYRDVLKRQYQNLKYDIVEETINGDNAIVKVKVTVYDLHNSSIESENYMNEHSDEFLNTDNMFDEASYMKFRLDQMMKANDTITHDISFNLTKVDNEWEIAQIDRETLEKIHGLYNYNLD